MSVWENGPDPEAPRAPDAFWPISRAAGRGGEPAIPVYVQLAEVLAFRIRGGELTGQLPGVAQLQVEYGLGHRTVRRALFALRHQGLIANVPYRGWFVAEEVEGGE